MNWWPTNILAAATAAQKYKNAANTNPYLSSDFIFTTIVGMNLNKSDLNLYEFKIDTYGNHQRRKKT